MVVVTGEEIWVAEPEPEGLFPLWLTLWRVDGEGSWDCPDDRRLAMVREG